MFSTFSGKILFFIESGGPGGAERVVLSLAEEYQRRGMEVLVATLRRGWFTDQITFRRVPHTLLPSTGDGFDFGLVRSLRQLFEKERPALVHSHLLDSNFYASIACRLSRVPHVATEHGDVHHTKPKRFAKLKMMIADRLGTKFTAVSGFTARELRRRGVRAKSITVVGNPVSRPRFDHRPERANIRAKLGVTEERDNHWVWVHVANFRPVKDQATLLRGFSQSLKTAPLKQTLVLVGDGPEKESLLSLAGDLGLRNEIRWVGFSDDVALYLAAADGFILSSLSEAQPMSLLEAALHELVLVSTSVGGVPEIVRDGKTGYLFERSNPASLATVITRTLSHREEAARCAASAHALVEREFLLERVVEKMFDVYSAAAATRRSS